jgi:hypothetical protein
MERASVEGDPASRVRSPQEEGKLDCGDLWVRLLDRENMHYQEL